MIDRDHGLSLGRQATALGISRGSVYSLPRPTSDADLVLMRRIDELHLEYPFAGSRMLKGLLQAEGHSVGRLHVSALMRKMAITALYRRPNTSKPAPGHKVHPSLLRNVAVTRPDQVWVIDWFSRKVLAWRLSITLSADFCVEALEDALACQGRPEILNTDQGSQFTSIAFIKALKDAEIAISMGGKGTWRDDVFVERLWRTVKYEELHLRAYGGVSEARASIGRYLGFYNGTRLHSSLDGQTPDQAYLNQPTPIPAAGNQGAYPRNGSPEAVQTNRANFQDVPGRIIAIGRLKEHWGDTRLAGGIEHAEVAAMHREFYDFMNDFAPIHRPYRVALEN
jgi:putative transposase